jgi:hypothetical protein
MKKLICILASAALLGACEQKTDVVAPAPEKKAQDNTAALTPPASTETGQKIRKATDTTNTMSRALAPATSTEKKTESATTETKTESATTDTKAEAATTEARITPITTEMMNESATTSSPSP